MPLAVLWAAAPPMLLRAISRLMACYGCLGWQGNSCTL
jgi:hypothetical protein